MTNYYVEVQIGGRWRLQKSFSRQTDALHHVKEHISEYNRYPLRVIREVRTVIFMDRNK